MVKARYSFGFTGTGIATLLIRRNGVRLKRPKNTAENADLVTIEANMLPHLVIR